MSQIQPSLQQQVDHWKGILQGDRMRAAIEQACGKHLTPERVLRTALFAMTKTPKLLQCTPGSVVGAIVECSVLGLELLGNQAAMVPLKIKGTLTAQLWIGFEGKLTLAWRSGLVNAVTQESVHGGDVFPYADVQGDGHALGDMAVLRHVKVDGPRTRETLRYAYTYAWLKGDPVHPAVKVLTRSEIESAFERAKRKGDESPWVTDYPAMARKTATHQLTKTLPKDYAGQRAQELESEYDRGEQNLGALLDVQTAFVDAEFTSEPAGTKPAAPANRETKQGAPPRKKPPRKRPARKGAAKPAPQDAPGSKKPEAPDVGDRGTQEPDTEQQQGPAGAPPAAAKPSTSAAEPARAALPVGAKCVAACPDGSQCYEPADGMGPGDTPLCAGHLLALPDVDDLRDQAAEGAEQLETEGGDNGF